MNEKNTSDDLLMNELLSNPFQMEAAPHMEQKPAQSALYGLQFYT